MRRTLITAALTVGCLSASSSLAQSAREDRPNGPQNPPNPPRDVRPFQPGPMRMEKGPFLGVSTSPAPQVLRRQLALPNGVGLVVDAVTPNGPAADAGLKEYDVLHKLNEQVLVNQQQLAVLVRTFKPNDTVKLTVFRDGKSMELSAKLEERDLPPLDQLRFGMDNPFGGGFDPFRGGGGDGMPNMPEFPNFRPGGGGGAGAGGPFDPARGMIPRNLMNEEFALAWDDGKVQMNLTSKNGKRHLVARDKDGNELYNGPVDTEEQVKALPPEVRERLPKVGPPGMFRFGGPNDQRAGGERRDPPRGGRPADRPDGQQPGGDRPSTGPATRDGDGDGGRKVDRRRDI